MKKCVAVVWQYSVDDSWGAMVMLCDEDKDFTTPSSKTRAGAISKAKAGMKKRGWTMVGKWQE